MAEQEIPLVDLGAQHRSLRGEIEGALERVFSTSGFILGEEVKRFEERFAAYSEVPHAVGVASGTAALHLALVAGKVGPGHEVITTPLTFAATAEAICHAGARPVFADIDPVTCNLDPGRVEEAVTAHTKAVVPVHLYGQPVDVDAFSSVAEQHDLLFIEDAAQAHGAEYGGMRAGGLGDAACFSFYPGKVLGACGDAGMVTTRDGEIAERVRMLRDHGRRGKYEHERIGYGERLDALQAAILDVKLSHLDDWVRRRRRVAALYREALDGTAVSLLAEKEDVRHAYHLFVVRVAGRDAVLRQLREEGIGAGVHYPIPLHLQPAFQDLGYAPGDFPHAERASDEVLSLPIFPEMTEEQVGRVAEGLLRALDAPARARVREGGNR